MRLAAPTQVPTTISFQGAKQGDKAKFVNAASSSCPSEARSRSGVQVEIHGKTARFHRFFLILHRFLSIFGRFWLLSDVFRWSRGEQETPPDKDVGQGHASFVLSGAGSYVLCYTAYGAADSVQQKDIVLTVKAAGAAQNMWGSPLLGSLNGF